MWSLYILNTYIMGRGLTALTPARTIGSHGVCIYSMLSDRGGALGYNKWDGHAVKVLNVLSN